MGNGTPLSFRERSASGGQNGRAALSVQERRERPRASGSGRPVENGADARHCPCRNVASAQERPAAVGQLRTEQMHGIVRAGTSRAPRGVRQRSANGEQNSAARRCLCESVTSAGASGCC
ncbi:hypothetical protein [Paenibacillus elgii]|uniref:hypothetical protein n=1 Tax=Paenibacillus elgii TaxID=189691 RepID=UPI0012FA9C02|nr:hypothetical protein [Paenibacillus elgii]